MKEESMVETLAAMWKQVMSGEEGRMIEPFSVWFIVYNFGFTGK